MPRAPGTYYAFIRRAAELRQSAVQVPVDLTKIEQMVLDEVVGAANPTRDATATLFCECSDGSTVACTDSGSCPGGNPKNQYVSVTVEEDFETLFGYPLIGKSFSIRSDATFRVD